MRRNVNAPCVTHFAKNARMDTVGKRLRWARENHSPYETGTDAARAYGWPVSTYLGHENGDRNPSRERAKKYARAYKVRWEWLLEGEGNPTPKEQPRPRVVGYVGAGAEVIPLDEHGSGESVDLPPPNAEAVIVRGDSMYPRYQDGEKLLYVPEDRPASDLIGRECVVKLSDGRMLVKQIRRRIRGNRYDLASYNAPMIEDVEVEWAAPVMWRAP